MGIENLTNIAHKTNIGDIVSVTATTLFPEDQKELSECVANHMINLEKYVDKYKMTSYKVTARTVPSHATQKYFVQIVARVKGQDLIVKEASNGEVSICKAYTKANSELKRRIYSQNAKDVDSKRKPYK